MNLMKWLSVVTYLAVIYTQSAWAGEAALGAKKFTVCKACHEISTPKNRLGPSLQGVMGRKAGTLEGFKYSDAMKTSGITWDATTLAAYLANPKAYIPGNKMTFAGVKKPEDLENLLAYLEEASK